MKKIGFLIATLGTICLTSCNTSIKTIGGLLNIKVNDVTNLEIVRISDDYHYEINLEKKDVFLESLFKIKVDTSQVCKCIGSQNVIVYTNDNTYAINEFHTDTNTTSYHYTIKGGDLDNLITQYVNNAL